MDKGHDYCVCARAHVGNGMEVEKRVRRPREYLPERLRARVLGWAGRGGDDGSGAGGRGEAWPFKEWSVSSFIGKWWATYLTLSRAKIPPHTFLTLVLRRSVISRTNSTYLITSSERAAQRYMLLRSIQARVKRVWPVGGTSGLYLGSASRRARSVSW